MTVLRQQQGDIVLLFNGRDGEWQGRITGIAKKQLSVQLERQTRQQQSAPDIWLAFAPVKTGRIDVLVSKATELGVSRLLPVQTERTVVSRVNHHKCCMNAIEAAEQTQRLDVPDVASYQPLDRLLDGWDHTRPLIYGDETGQGAHAAQLLPGHRPPLCLLIGPEGGFSPREHAYLHAASYTHALSLGPRILRADTAAFAGLTLLQAYCGDW